jgi:hypothetical protein
MPHPPGGHPPAAAVRWQGPRVSRVRAGPGRGCFGGVPAVRLKRGSRRTSPAARRGSPERRPTGSAAAGPATMVRPRPLPTGSGPGGRRRSTHAGQPRPAVAGALRAPDEPKHAAAPPPCSSTRRGRPSRRHRMRRRLGRHGDWGWPARETRRGGSCRQQTRGPAAHPRVVSGHRGQLGGRRG